MIAHPEPPPAPHRQVGPRRAAATPGTRPEWSRAVIALSALTLLTGCTTRSLAPQVVVAGAPMVLARDAAARAAFVADRPAPGAEFSCSAPQPRSDGRTLVRAHFPSEAAPQAVVSVTVDSAGRWREIDERRGLVRIDAVARASTDALRLAAIREAEARERVTVIVFRRDGDLGGARNTGGGRPEVGIGGTVQEIAALPGLDAPLARALAVLARCATPAAR